MSATHFDPKKQSPLDLVEEAPVDLIQIRSLDKDRQWRASRYNLKTTRNDGSYIVWNSFTGAMSVFKPPQRQAVQALLRSGYSGEPRGIVKYLLEQGFLIPEGTNEYRQIQLHFGQTHYRNDTLELILLASEDCNFRCTYCYEDFSRGTMLPSVRQGVKKLVEKRAPNLRQLTIGWFGGEPLYGFKAMEDLAPFFIEITDEYSIRYSSHITTNAYLLTPEVAEKLLAWKVLHYQITLDGMPEQHDAKRRARDGSGTFATIFSNLRSLKKRPEDFRVRIRVNYDRQNHPHLEALLSQLQVEFAGDPRFGVAFHGVGKWGGANDDALDVCGAAEAGRVRDQLRKSAIKKGLDVKGTLRDMNGLGKGVCYAARPYNFVVGADGKLMKCTVALDKQEHNLIGNLTSEGEMVLNIENYALWVEPAFQSDPLCRRCCLLPTCGGIACPLIRINNGVQPCLATPKSMLRNELLLAMETAQVKSREITVTGDA